MAWNRIQLCVLLAALCVGIAAAQPCISVNDVLPQMPKDLQDLVKQRMDVLAFTGTFFVPTEAAWKNRGLDGKMFTKRILGSIIDLGIVPGVRFAERPTADRKNGTVQLESRFKNDQGLFCLTVDEPDNKLDVEIRVTGSPNGADKSRFSVTPIPGNTYKAGNGTITIVKVYSDIRTQNLTGATGEVSYIDAIRNSDDDDELKRVLGDKFNQTLRNLSSNWTPANVVRVVQCEKVDVFFTDHLLLPCPLCGNKCNALIVSKLVMIVLPITTVFAVILAVTGYVAMCCGDKLCSQSPGACGCFFKVVCGSIMFVVVLLELAVVALFIVYAHYFYKFGHDNKTLAAEDKWRPYFIWSVVGVVVTSLVIVSHVYSIFSKSCKRRNHHKEFHNPPPPPQTQFYTTPGQKYTPVGAVPPMTA